ncbi:MAG: N-methyl-L-tryptophan oxidase [Chloroflexi bacterium]|nr:N-methyl-L-tryptophan oxidase [Chloroflexota bacterium]MCY4246764.1 N-methyl-L-tryptophan oxidase [Chloroflexota bacterium]
MAANQYDIIIVGLGAMGAAALYQASQRGARVLGIDRYDPPHALGSSHGDTRITRLAIGEGEMYMPFIQRANQIWAELEAKSGRTLFHQSGGLVIAPEQGAAKFHAEGDFVDLSARIARKFGIAHEILDAAQIARRFPLLTPRDCDHAYYEPESGVLRPERCIQTQLELALADQAVIHACEAVVDYRADASGVTVRTDKARYRADKLILCAGAWMSELLPAPSRDKLRVYRQVIYWYEAPDLTLFDPAVFPYVIWIGDAPADFWSVFPAPADGLPGVKVLSEQYHTSEEVHAISREVTPAEIADMHQRLTAQRLRGTTERLLRADVCLYTVTRDEHFIIDFHPESRRVVLASPCSGHGFKHSAAIGETLAQLALDGGAQFDVSGFALEKA